MDMIISLILRFSSLELIITSKWFNPNDYRTEEKETNKCENLAIGESVSIFKKQLSVFINRYTALWIAV